MDTKVPMKSTKRVHLDVGDGKGKRRIEPGEFIYVPEKSVHRILYYSKYLGFVITKEEPENVEEPDNIEEPEKTVKAPKATEKKKTKKTKKTRSKKNT